LPSPRRGCGESTAAAAAPGAVGLIGACAAVAAGVLVNDSGATFPTLGALALGAALAFAWAQTPMNDP
jgi:hypothetical protein